MVDPGDLGEDGADGLRPSGTGAGKPLPYTGERFHPELLGEIRQEHMHRYAWCASLATGKDVVDLASGEGFGSFMLSQHARSVTGVDVAADAVAHAADRYRRANLTFVCADAGTLPLADESADLIVSFETIEHVERQAEMIAEMRRVLRPEGLLVISSPNRDVYSEKQGHANPFHKKELDRAEFEALLTTSFAAVRLFGQRLCVASSILPAETRLGRGASVFLDDGSVRSIAQEMPATMYFIAVASKDKRAFSGLKPSFLVSANYDVYWDMRDRIAEQKDAIASLGLPRAAESQNQGAWFRTLSERAGAPATVLASGFLDVAGYAARAGIPHTDAEFCAKHYLLIGERLRLDPGPRFDIGYYLKRNPDVAGAELSALLHFLRFGRFEGRHPVPPPQAP